MKSFKSFISEEVLPTANVENGNFDVANDAVRGQINATLASVTAQASVTPYVLLRKVSKALAYFHIILPKRTFLEGEKGIEVYEVMQFGDKMGMNDQGEFIREVPNKYFLFFQYSVAHPFNVTYTRPNIDGMFRGIAKIVDQADLDKLLNAAEAMMAECWDDKATMSQLKAGREDIQTNGNNGTVSTKKAMDTSERTKDKKLASDKLDKEWPAVVKEEEQIDEISDKMKKRYVDTAYSARHPQGEKTYRSVPPKGSLDDLYRKQGKSIDKKDDKQTKKLGDKIRKREDIAGKVYKELKHKRVSTQGPNWVGGRITSAMRKKLKEESLDEGMAPIKKSYAMRKMKEKVATKVKRGLGVGKEKTSTVLVTNKGDPHAATGGGVHRIPKDKYDPAKHNLASE